MKTLIALALLATSMAASAQTIYRCGADGRSYSDSPCPEGRVVAVADTRTAGERSAAAEVLARDRALARQLREDRLALQREHAAQGNGLAGIRHSVAAEAKPAAKPKTGKQEKREKAGKAAKLKPPADGTSPSAARAFRPRSG